MGSRSEEGLPIINSQRLQNTNRPIFWLLLLKNEKDINYLMVPFLEITISMKSRIGNQQPPFP